MSESLFLAVLGSPRKNSNSSILAREIAGGISENGGKVEIIQLQGLKINTCLGCDVCKKEGSLGCIQDDDMKPLYPKIRQARGIIYASPIYWFTVSAQLKLFMDRCYALPTEWKNPFKGKRMAVALAYGDEDPYSSGAINAIRTFQDAFDYLESELIGMVYGSALKEGDIKKNTDLLIKARELGKKVVCDS